MSAENIIHDAARALARATVYPFIVRAYAEKADGTCELFAEVIERPLHHAPIGHDVIPKDAKLLWASIYPASRFDDMNRGQRESHRGDYHMYLMWRRAKAIGKAREDLVPWVDYDAVMIENEVLRWMNPVGRYWGD
jgi:hypothetical protein